MMDYVKIGGTDRPVKFGWNALRIYTREAKIPFMDIGNLFDSMDLDKLTILTYAGLVHGARTEKKDVDFTLDDVGDWLGEDFDVVSKFLEIFTEQMPQPKNQKAPAK